MKEKSLNRIIVFIASISMVSVIAVNRSHTFARNEQINTQGDRFLLSQQNFPVETEIRQLTQQWIAGWSPGAEPLNPDELQPLYAQGENAILVYDDIGDEVAVIRSWNEYVRTWQPFMEQFAYWKIQPEGDIEVKATEDMAMSNFAWVGEGRYRDGREVTPKQYATLVWQKQNGNWVIVHEHLTAANN